MVKSIVLIAVILAVNIHSLNAVPRPERKLDCSAVISNYNLGTFEDGVCSTVADESEDTAQAKIDLVSKNLMNRLDLVETCTCSLLHHELAWKTMLTPEVEALYLSTEDLIRGNLEKREKGEAKDGDDNEQNIQAIKTLLGRIDGDERLFLWDALRDILNKADNKAKAIDSFISELTGKLGKNYYDPDNFALDMRVGYELTNMVSRTCKSLEKTFDPFLKYFKNLRYAAKNDRFVDTINLYNSDLYKLNVVAKVCDFLRGNGFSI